MRSNNESGNNFELISAKIKVENLVVGMAATGRGKGPDRLVEKIVRRNGIVVERVCDSMASTAATNKSNEKENLRIGFSAGPDQWPKVALNALKE